MDAPRRAAHRDRLHRRGIDLFIARKLTLSERKLDAGEFLETFTVPFGEAVAMIRDGRITDAKTVAALLWVHSL
jgi:ADP-ribose pyrophosphatase